MPFYINSCVKGTQSGIEFSKYLCQERLEDPKSQEKGRKGGRKVQQKEKKKTKTKPNKTKARAGPAPSSAPRETHPRRSQRAPTSLHCPAPTPQSTVPSLDPLPAALVTDLCKRTAKPTWKARPLDTRAARARPSKPLSEDCAPGWPTRTDRMGDAVMMRVMMDGRSGKPGRLGCSGMGAIRGPEQRSREGKRTESCPWPGGA